MATPDLELNLPEPRCGQMARLAALLLAAVAGGAALGWLLFARPAACLGVADILKNQKAWADALVHIGDEWRRAGCDGALPAAVGAIDAYAPPLLFKPTVTYDPNTFRNTRDRALSYFVGACAPVRVGDDHGFALGFLSGDVTNQSTWAGYSRAVFHDFEYLVGGDHCHAPVAQGKLTVTSRRTGLDGTVDKTFVYAPSAGDGLRARLVAHHSSFEVQPPLPTAPTGVCCTWIDADEADKRGVYWNAVGGGVCGAVDGYDVALCAASSAYECTPRNCLPGAVGPHSRPSTRTEVQQ